ncbi:Dihydroorotate dehydrogenase B (NAD(+)), electron transfer subunit [Pelotomaculum schinkii]|uniref:Dihydroorotate dehydrogenase B (NAD(+)), electron transfer subunit n=1 Tax=Pelotomaculum schinkii TaxID=78350 RepID=A0A4Y7R9Y7_9FIRM|nr:MULTISPECIES: dihydroorotate dehydrogenase electron transfer subunit [Pelotomaculum]TEB05764.1 Dihydroorotate dehydrogenase B (NAD(+)), electron transfer subunit [Pelotomaculum schinkii]TEB17934.1 Dihydroorotate dehydrogenase B (NAD(+)), electron transfer subunit [Pelotomaculum sp. FP]
MSLVTDAKVIQNKQVIPGYYRMDLAAPSVTERARPGQFLHVRCGSTHDPLLRRPISINAVDRRTGEVSLLYRVAGRGTSLLAGHRSGDMVSIVGPLGRGFTIPEGNEKVIVVSGGIGIAPLYFFLQELAGLGIKATVFQGAATSQQVLLGNEIKELGHSVFIATDDGTRDFHGSVTTLFENYLQNSDFAPGPGAGENLIMNKSYACGPHGMLRKLSEITARWGIPCEVSLEERMGCGVGACLSCACKVKTGDGGSVYHRVCVEGPVFQSGEVSWE